MILEDLIKQEITDFINSYLIKHPDMSYDTAYCGYFNNFHLNLPYGLYQNVWEIAETELKIEIEESKKRLFSDIDIAINDSGIDLTKIKNLQKESKHHDVRKALFLLVFPAYILLRERGYSQSDLTR